MIVASLYRFLGLVVVVVRLQHCIRRRWKGGRWPAILFLAAQAGSEGKPEEKRFLWMPAV
jgi:hypothetical protein